MGAFGAQDERTDEADGEVVWCASAADLKFQHIALATVTRKFDHRRERAVSGKNHSRANAG